MVNRIKFVLALVLCITAGAILTNSCVHAPYVLPVGQRTGDPNICFENDILPIFVSNCAKSGCHDAQSHVSEYVLDNYQDIMKKGIVPGNIAASKIWESVAIGSTEGGIMPMGAAALNATQLDLLRRWIQTGAIDSGACSNLCDTANYTYSSAIAPMVNTYCVGCHNSASVPGGSLMDYNSVKTAAVSGRLMGDISHQSGYVAMPPGIQLSSCQITQFEKWVAAGALNN